MEAIEAHEKPKKAVKQGVDEDHPGRLREPPPLPGCDPVLHPGHSRVKVSHGEMRVTNWYPQVGRGERTQPTIQLVGQSPCLLRGYPRIITLDLSKLIVSPGICWKQSRRNFRLAMSSSEPSTIIMVSSAYCRRETPLPGEGLCREYGQ